MNIHEYQAKTVLRSFGVPTPRGIPAFTPDEAVKAARELATPVLVVKAQIHAGGRGKAGGVKVVKSIDDVQKEATRLLGSVLVTHQTGPHGKQVNRLYIEEGSAIDKEFYLSMLVDRATSRVALSMFQLIRLSTSPLRGMPRGRITSNALIRSLATITMRPSARVYTSRTLPR